MGERFFRVCVLVLLSVLVWQVVVLVQLNRGCGTFKQGTYGADFKFPSVLAQSLGVSEVAGQVAFSGSAFVVNFQQTNLDGSIQKYTFPNNTYVKDKCNLVITTMDPDAASYLKNLKVSVNPVVEIGQSSSLVLRGTLDTYIPLHVEAKLIA